MSILLSGCFIKYKLSHSFAQCLKLTFGMFLKECLSDQRYLKASYSMAPSRRSSIGRKEAYRLHNIRHVDRESCLGFWVHNEILGQGQICKQRKVKMPRRHTRRMSALSFKKAQATKQMAKNISSQLVEKERKGQVCKAQERDKLYT